MSSSDKVYRVSEKEHTRLVQHAKNMMAKYIEAKWAICDVAIKICHLPEKKGGRIPKNHYTITDLADDIGMNRKTLSCWLLDYEIYKHLDIDMESMNLSEAKRVNGAIARTRAKLFNMNSSARSDLRNADANRIRKTYDEIMNEDPLIQRLDDFIKYLKHQHYTLGHEEFRKKHVAKLEEYQDELYAVNRQLRKVLNNL